MNSKIEPPAEQQSPPAPQPRVVWNWAKAFAWVAVTGILASAFLLRECGKHTERLAQIAKETAADGIAAIAGAFKPTINVNSTISTTVSRMRDAAKLVVLVEDPVDLPRQAVRIHLHVDDHARARLSRQRMTERALYRVRRRGGGRGVCHGVGIV